jgi:ribosome-binding factor A
VLGTEEELEQTMEGLESAKGFMRRELAHRLNMRNTPELTLIKDRSIERGVEMSKKIDEVMREDERMRELSGRAEEDEGEGEV